MNHTNNPKTNSRWTVFAALAVMTVVLRFVIVADAGSSDGWGCAGAYVTIGDATWSDSVCSPHVQLSPERIPVMTSECDVLEGKAGAGANNLQLYYTEEGCVLDYEGVEGSVSADPGGTGCDIKITKAKVYDAELGLWVDAFGMWDIRISGPKRPGTVTITATATGDCLDCPEWYDDMCEDCSISSGNTATAVGKVQVDVPPEDDGGGGGGGCGGLGCASGVDGYRQLGAAYVGNSGGVDFRLNLGRATPEYDAGYLSLYAEVPSDGLARPGSLAVPFDPFSFLFLLQVLD